MKCPRCGAPLVVDPIQSFCELETCPEVGAAMVMCSRHYLLGDWRTGCMFSGCPAILPRLATERARLLGLLVIAAVRAAGRAALARKEDKQR